MNRSTALIIILGIGVFFFLFGSLDATPHAENIVEVCVSEKDRSACYEREVPLLLPELSLPEMFEMLRRIRELDPSYQFCHVLAHKIGEFTVAEDPAQWVDAIPHNPSDGLCSNGYIHGVVGGRFRAEVLDNETLEKLIPDFSRACEHRVEWEPSALDQAICYHGMGHLYMFITDAEIPKALSLCERTAQGKDPRQDFRQVCREGVFMQIYQPLEPDDFLLIERMPEKPTKETVREFCARYERDEYEGACLRESWPFFREELMNGNGVGAFCSEQPNAREEDSCYMAIFSILGRFSLGAHEQVLNTCIHVPEERKAMCYEYGARTILEEDRGSGDVAISFCESVPEDYREDCLDALASTAGFIFGETEQRTSFCAMLPAPFAEVCAR